MTVVVDIADRLYDYTDEEKAAEAIAQFQLDHGLDDAAIVTIWGDNEDGRRAALETVIFNAVDANGSVKRAQESVPGGIELTIES
jgi:hypothetical protein